MSHLRSRPGQKYITFTTNKSKAHHSGRLRLPQRIWRSTGSGHPDSQRHRDRLCMATMLPDKQQLFDYASNCMQTSIYEIGRPNSILQSDNEPYLKALLQPVANKIGSISVRHSPAYSSQSQGSIERLHRTLFGQVRILKEQIRQCYDISITMKHPITPWVIKHSAFLINTYLIHSDGHTSYFRRWKSDNKTPICEFGEIILYMVAGASKHQPKLENRFFKGIWLGKDTTSGESYIGSGGRVIKARTIRRQVMLYKYNQQLMGTVNGTPWAAKPPTYTPNFIVPSLPLEPKPETSDKNISTQEDKPGRTTTGETTRNTSSIDQSAIDNTTNTSICTILWTSTFAPRRRNSSIITTTSNTRWQHDTGKWKQATKANRTWTSIPSRSWHRATT